jgi:hypothetical protein
MCSNNLINYIIELVFALYPKLTKVDKIREKLGISDNHLKVNGNI